MAGISSLAREQLRAIAVLRWQLSINSLRSVRGRLNLVSRSFAGLLVVGAGVGGGIATGAACWGIVREGNLAWLAVPCWLISVFWQMFPVMASAFTQNVDTSAFLRFPLSYWSYFVVRMVYGSLDIATALGLCWSLGLLVGTSVAEPELLPWALVAVSALVALNLLLARTVFVWIEHWLALRRSREVMGVLFLLLLICTQLAGPMLGRYNHMPAMNKLRVLRRLAPVVLALPPGLTSTVIQEAAEKRGTAALTTITELAGYACLIFIPLHLRLRKQFRGEIISFGHAPKAELPEPAKAVRRGWRLPLVSGQVSAVFEKELHYYSRSGPMLFTLVMPVVVIIILWGGRKGFFHQQAEYLFPVGAAYCLLVMNNILYNSLGGDAGGIQFLLFSPVPFRTIMLAKNLAQSTVLLAEVAVLWIGVSLIYQPPSLNSLALAMAWYLVAAPLNFSAGNLLSVYSPKRIDYSTFGRQRASESAIFVSLAVQVTGVGLGALAIFIGYHFGRVWIGTLVLLALGIPSVFAYKELLRRMDGIIGKRGEVLATELCRTPGQ